MGTVTVSFVGIVTQFYADENLNLPAPARFVCVGGTAGGTVAEHQPSIMAEDANGTVDLDGVACLTEVAGESGRYWLNGVTLRVLSAGSLPVERPECIPSLTEIYPSMELATSVLYSGASPARAYFDITGGTLTTFLTSGAVATLLTLEAATTNVTLQFQCWSGTTTNVTLVTPAEIVVKNAAVSGGDGDDFLLSYGVGTYTPTPVQVPDLEDILEAAVTCAGSTLRVPALVGRRESQYLQLGPECSNSGYP